MNTIIKFTQILICLGLVLSSSHAGVKNQPPNTKSPLKLYMFDCGKLNYDDDTLKFFSISPSETKVRDLFVPCYVIEHQKGRLLWEGGLPSSSTGTYDWQEKKGWRMRLDKTFQAQLAQIGLGMDDFDYMAFSHLHFDHVGIANDVQGATLFIQKKEYEAGFAKKITVPAFKPELYSKLEHADKVLLNGGHDIFGDGRVMLIPTPGHTPGHQVLFLDLEKTGPILLSGDLYHFRVSREKKLVPSFNVDEKESVESIDKIEKFIKKTGAKLWIEHELAQYERIKKMPTCELTPVLVCS